MANAWETLWDGEPTTNGSFGGNGVEVWLWQDTEDSKNILAPGDIVRVNVNGTVYNNLIVQEYSSGSSIVQAGNRWLSQLKGNDYYPDDGTDIYFWEANGGLRFYTREFVARHVKFERAITTAVNPPDPLSLVMGYRVGCAIRANRGKKRPIAYLYNGVQLPPLPEWDREKYPYSVIYEEKGNYAGAYRETYGLYCFAEPLQKTAIMGYVTEHSGTRLRFEYIPTYGDTDWKTYPDEEYGEISGKGQAWSSNRMVWLWTNHDIINYDGSVYLSASDPIPVYA